MKLLWGALAGATLVAQAPNLTYDACVAALKVPPELIAAESFLGSRSRELASTRGFLREGPTLGLAAGPRRGDGTSTDKGADLDLPLFLQPGKRGALERALAAADPVLRRAADLEGRRRLRASYLEAWLAQRVETLRREDLGTVKAWLASARSRVAASADAPYQATLVAGEVIKAEAALRDASRRRQETWGALRALAALPEDPQDLADPGPLPERPSGDLRAHFEGGALRQSLRLRAAADEAGLALRTALDTSRWSLKGSYATEGADRIARFGVSVRLPRAGETRAIQHQAEAERAALHREADQALVALEARFRTALSHELPRESPEGEELREAASAIALRLAEGKDRPSEALPLRRQILEAQEALLATRASAHALAAELLTLTR